MLGPKPISCIVDELMQALVAGAFSRPSAIHELDHPCPATCPMLAGSAS